MPTALTLHNIDDELYAAVRDYAERSKSSLGAAFKQLARRALGLPTEEEQARLAEWKKWREEFPPFSDDEMRAMHEALELQSQVEPEMWK